ncbi:MAG: hypothetical protein VX519_01665 [Myxococcota bacterium]|nr:hypothetical protein [Myxococcota bacterium]
MRYLLILGLLSACSGGEKDTGIEETGTEETGGSETGLVEVFAPSTGTWKLSGVTYESNTCEIDEVAVGEDGEEGTWVLTAAEGGGYTLSPASFLASFNCSLEGQELFCDTLSFEEALQDVNATVTQAFSMGMVFSDTSTAQGSWGLNKTCAGTDCDGVACEVLGTAAVSLDASES